MSALLKADVSAELESFFQEIEGDQVGWLGTDQHAGWQLRKPAPEALQSRSIDQIALAVAVGALPLSELRRSLEEAGASLGRAGETNQPDGAEDSGCGSFLDRFLGAGVEPACEDALELFAPPALPRQA